MFSSIATLSPLECSNRSKLSSRLIETGDIQEFRGRSLNFPCGGAIWASTEEKIQILTTGLVTQAILFASFRFNGNVSDGALF